MSSIRVLSLTQPWASLVMLGAKKIETRSWPAPKAMIGQRIAIHASKGFPPDARDACLDPAFFRALWPNMVSHAENDRPLGRYIAFPTAAGGWRHYNADEIERLTGTLARGVVLATARLTGCWSTNRLDLIDRLPERELAFGNYGPDRWMWGLDDVEVLPEPIAAKGALGLWRWEMPKLRECVCLAMDAYDCFRLRNGYDPMLKYGIPETCECTCHEEDEEDAA